MSGIKSKNTKFELSIFSLLRKKGLRFKKHYSKIIGKPDVAIPSKKKAIFIDSDFWHGWRFPQWKEKLTTDFWVKKIEANRRRDRAVNRELKRIGWRVLRVWEHQLSRKTRESAMAKMVDFLTK